MIKLYSGTPGSGKSYHMAYNIYRRLRAGQAVISTFDINRNTVRERAITWYLRKLLPFIKPSYKKIGDYIYIDKYDLTVDYLIDYAIKNHKRRRENQTLLLIDECADIFNSREWDKKDRRRWIEFFQKHRHLGYNVILVAQHDRLIDRQIRAFIEYNVIHRCVNNYKLFGLILGLLSGGKLFVAITQWYGMRIKTDSEWLRLNRRIASIYDAFELFDSLAASVGGDPAVQGGT